MGNTTLNLIDAALESLSYGRKKAKKKKKRKKTAASRGTSIPKRRKAKKSAKKSVAKKSPAKKKHKKARRSTTTPVRKSPRAKKKAKKTTRKKTSRKTGGGKRKGGVGAARANIRKIQREFDKKLNAAAKRLRREAAKKEKGAHRAGGRRGRVVKIHPFRVTHASGVQRFDPHTGRPLVSGTPIRMVGRRRRRQTSVASHLRKVPGRARRVRVRPHRRTFKRGFFG